MLARNCRGSVRSTVFPPAAQVRAASSARTEARLTMCTSSWPWGPPTLPNWWVAPGFAWHRDRPWPLAAETGPSSCLVCFRRSYERRKDAKKRSAASRPSAVASLTSNSTCSPCLDGPERTRCEPSSGLYEQTSIFASSGELISWWNLYFEPCHRGAAGELEIGAAEPVPPNSTSGLSASHTPCALPRRSAHSRSPGTPQFGCRVTACRGTARRPFTG
mmetsp:Transcript_56125/g.166920  ORF Transcript_56125/g.166920 Transcript_56125/m.166920 type:complete len:218 (+) Transcript_56125:476-1129(+)